MWGKKGVSEKRRAYMRQWRALNREKCRLDSQKWYARLCEQDPSRSRRYHRRAHLKYTFGMTLEEYDELLLAQEGVCAVCRREETSLRRGVVKSLDVDHDHKTGEIRGLLCSACNTALGLLQDDPLRIRALSNYIERK
jgi:hypothetical protein